MDASPSHKHGGEHEDSADSSSTESRHTTLWVTLSVLLLVVYPLSPGPLVYLVEKKIVSDKRLSPLFVVYVPLALFCKKVPPTQKALEAYLEWWGELAHR